MVPELKHKSLFTKSQKSQLDTSRKSGLSNFPPLGHFSLDSSTPILGWAPNVQVLNALFLQTGSNVQIVAIVWLTHRPKTPNYRLFEEQTVKDIFGVSFDKDHRVFFFLIFKMLFDIK
jgi:hypothetical protein